eukprot:gene14494-19456_t
MFQDHEIISFLPHFKTITESGRSHFLRVADAVAEFVDNSIQACGKVQDVSAIDISFHLNFQKTSVLATILDNGCGMNSNGIKDFATFSLDQATRNNSAEEGDTTFISKFGVGAKQAGFFLGHSIKIITKDESSDCVSCFTMDTHSFEQRYEENVRNNSNQNSLYQSVIIKKPLNAIMELLDNEKEFQNHKMLLGKIANHININPTFTIILIQLIPATTDKLENIHKWQSLCHDIATIYHFHLHLEDIALTKRVRNPFDFSQSSQQSVQNSISGFHQLEIQFNIFKEENHVLSVNLSKQELNDEDINYTPLYQCIKLGNNRNDPTKPLPLKFSITIPSPNLTTGRSNEVRPTEKHTVNGILFYYPYKDGKSTKPKSNSFYEVETNSNSTDHVFDVFWQNRLVPETHVEKLSFFPKTVSNIKKQCLDMKISMDWKNRIKGLLFFDWNFKHISNNKLKIQVDPNLNDWINSQEVMEKLIYSHRGLDLIFIKWLQDWHKFDKEFKFSDREPKQSSNNLIVSNNSNNREAVFKVLKYGNEKVQILKATESIKFQSNNKKEKHWIFAQIIDFEVEPLASEEEVYYGLGKFRFYRLPKEIYGEDEYHTYEEMQPVTAIDFNKYRFDPKRDGKYKELLGFKVKDLRLFLCEAGNNHMRKLIKENNFEMIVNHQYEKIGIEIKVEDETIKNVNRIPFTNPARKYKIGLIFKFPTTGKEYNVGETSTLYYTPDQSDEVRGDQEANTSQSLSKDINCFYGFYKISITDPGPFELITTLKDGDRIVLTKICRGVAVVEKIDHIKIVGPFDVAYSIG